MLYPDKLVTVTMTADVAYSVLGLLVLARLDGHLVGGCKAEVADVPELGRLVGKLEDELVLSLDAHGYCEHVAEVAKELRTHQLQEKAKRPR